jgi:DNA-binding MltR family transcriptional regulator
MRCVLDKKEKKKNKEEKLADYKGYFDELTRESDRAVAIVGTAFLDEKLRELLFAFLIEEEKSVIDLVGDDEKPQQPLSSFSSRILACYCLGLISKEQKDDFTILRKVRNKFAHGLHGLSFDDPEIVSLCASLKYVRRFMPSAEPLKSRFCFSVTASLMATDIRTKSLSIGESKRKVFEDKSIILFFDNTLEEDEKSDLDQPE